MKSFKKLLLISLLIYCTNLHAQKSESASHWSIGLDIGNSFDESCGNCGSDEAVYTFLTGNTNIHYRIERWVGMTANLGYIYQHAYESISLWDIDVKEATMAQRDFSSNYFIFSLGPQFLLRLGQGDLSLEARYGWMMSTPRVTAFTSKGQSFDLRFKPEFEKFISYKLGYTYWPKPRFGVSFGIELLGDNSPDYGNYELTKKYANFYQNEKEAIIDQLSPEIDGPELANIFVGITYRFK